AALGARRRSLLALAAALALAVGLAGFGVGYAVRDPGREVDFEVLLAGRGEAAGASAQIEVFALDEAGNWPMEVHVRGLPPARDGRLYELWLTRDGKLAARCGGFLAEPDGSTDVPMNAPWRLRDFDGWVVVPEGSDEPVLST
ncbi:MAG TPA: anti-sigma factor, partial [Gaiellaceae bacterium]|nr:anti-sigma factor [Gaiellaceae bacterium]